MTDRLCDLWKSLFQDQANRGKIYSDFIKYQRSLGRHINLCKDCRKLITDAQQPQGGIIPDFLSMTEQEFSKSIRELWNLARQKNQTP